MVYHAQPGASRGSSTGYKGMAESSDTESVKQVGVLVVTHGEFGAALLSAAQMTPGEQFGCEAVSVIVTRGVEEIVADLKAASVRLDSGLGVMILTDLFGGTPTTLSLSLLKGGNVEVVSGVNLPMLIKVAVRAAP